jgi:N-hydroxyarylamine O-acetyltransferase
VDLDAYFARIGFKGPRVPTLDTLRALHLAHAQAIAFENLNPLMGWPVRLDLPSLEEKLVRSGRGGYCFEQNALLAAALQELGFTVTGLAARVILHAPEDAIRPRGHMLLKVEVAGEPYIADVGFGGQTLTGPLRLTAEGEQATPHEPFRLITIGYSNGTPELKLQSLVNGSWRSLYRFDLQPQHEPDYEVVNFYVSTHPASQFRTGIRIARPVPGGRYGLLNNHLSVHHLGGPSEQRILKSVAEVRETLQELFGLALPPAADLDPALARACAFPT